MPILRLQLATLFASSMVGLPSWAAPPPVADFFRNPQVNAVALSPSGKYVAATRADAKTNHHVLAMIDLGSRREAQGIAAYNDADVVDLHWVTDDRIVYQLGDQGTTYFNQYGRGLFSIDRKGDESPRVLIRRDRGTVVTVNAMTTFARPRDYSLDPNHFFLSTLHDGSTNVAVLKGNFTADGELTNTQLMRVDAETGRSEILSREMSAHATRWIVDAQGNPRLVYSDVKDKTLIHWRASSTTDGWSLLREMPRYDAVSGQGAVLRVLGLGDDDKLYVETSGGNPAGTSVLATMDLKSRDPQPVPLISTPGYDFDGMLVYGPKGKVVGIRYLTDAQGTHWFDPKLAAIQRQVDKLLPTTNNIIDCGDCGNPATVLVEAYSDRQPSVYLLYHVGSGKVVPVTGTRPWIEADKMAARGFERIKARDGLEFPLHVTRPNGVNGPVPTVVWVHGGPYLRGAEWRWYGQTQFLASRGYAVIEPEFRGSSGFGSKLSTAGWKQWGLAMQDDIADATRWAIAQGIADPKRICIAGVSYGGYAALMGLVRYPDLYRCGIEMFGITDIELMYTSAWSDLPGDYKTYGMPLLVGDRQKDAAQLEATSPLKQHARIHQPLLMAAGRQDQRVPIEHFNRLHDALKQHNPNVESVVYNEEGHGWFLDKNEIDFWTRAEKFLNKNLKSAP